MTTAGGPSGKATRIIFQTSAQLSGPFLTITFHIQSTSTYHQVDVLVKLINNTHAANGSDLLF